ncbi:MAG: hypothetical protein K2O08_05145, partial [Clostridia bacterium]|nr:hypothetical protein [Clostridia bacterium]
MTNTSSIKLKILIALFALILISFALTSPFVANADFEFIEQYKYEDISDYFSEDYIKIIEK